MNASIHLLLALVLAISTNFMLNRWKESKDPAYQAPRAQQVAQIGMLCILFIGLVYFANGMIEDRMGPRGGAPPSYAEATGGAVVDATPILKQPVPPLNIARVANEDIVTGMPDF